MKLTTGLTMQTLAEKCEAIKSVLFLLEDHFRMLDMGKIGSTLDYPRDNILASCAAPRCSEDEERWLLYQRQVSKRYRLYAVGWALARLRLHHPDQARAVQARYIFIPPLDWLDRSTQPELSEQGIEFMARDIPDDVPTYTPWHGVAEGERLVAGDRESEVLRLRMTGHTYAQIAKRLRCSKSTVRDICHAHLGRQRRTTDAGS